MFSQLKRPEENNSDSFQQPQQASGPHAHDWGGLGWNEPEWSSGPYPGGHAAQYRPEYDPQEDYGFGMDHGPVQGRNKQIEGRELFLRDTFPPIPTSHRYHQFQKKMYKIPITEIFFTWKEVYL